MPRTYSKQFIEQLEKSNPNRAGIALAHACVQGNLPAKYVAYALEVTRMTVFSWFRGAHVRHKNLLKIEAITDLIESDIAKGILPAKNNAEAKAYLEDMVGRSFDKK
ncbi:hypothetical protein EBT31_20705 [bacterium]|jgi:hypothetical protein|nr:hypothetical protein [bacterium]